MSARREVSGGDSATYLVTSQPVRMQNGMLTRKIDRQPTAAISPPPSTGPSATPIEPMPPQTPSARARGPASWNWCTISASEQGSSADAPSPCTVRAAISTPRPGAAAQAADPAAKAASPAMNTRFAPSRSAAEPAVSMTAARASVYASMTHCSPATEPPMSRWIEGSATLTIVTSSWMTKNPRHTATRASFAARSGPAVPAAPARRCVRAVVAGTDITPSLPGLVPVE